MASLNTTAAALVGLVYTGSGSDELTVSSGTVVAASTDLAGISGVSRFILTPNGPHRLALGDATFTGTAGMIRVETTSTIGVQLSATGIVGTTFRAEFYGSTGDDSLTGGPAGDVLFGGGGRDVLAGGTGNGADLLFGMESADSISAGGGADTVDGGEGADIIYGNQDNDVVYGGNDRDIIYGGQDSDLVYGNAGSDILYGNLDADTLYGGQGLDTLYGGKGEDHLYGNLSNDVVYGNLGHDWIHGGDGDDLLNGGDGADTLNGGAGADTLTGSTSGDIFVFAPGGGLDTITNDTGLASGPTADSFDFSAFSLDRDSDGAADVVTVAGDVSLAGAEVIVLNSAGPYASAAAAVAGLNTAVTTADNKSPGGDFLLVWESTRDGVMISHITPQVTVVTGPPASTTLAAASFEDIAFLAGLTSDNAADNLVAGNLIL